MKKFVLCIAMLVWSSAAQAGVSCSVPFNLTNGSTADASQVMANYNAILACLANDTAASGANDDITALLALTTPVPPSGGGTITYSGSSVSGTNAIIVASTVPGLFALTTIGQKVVFVATGSNTAATTLEVGAAATENFYRETPAGPQPMVGGEIAAGQIVEATWDGTEYQMTSAPALGHAPGESFDYVGANCPTGSLEANGAPATPQATYPSLFAVVGTLWGSAVGGNFTLPDLRGRATFSRDSSGTTRITVAGGNFDGSVVGHTGGQQNFDIVQTGLPNVSPTASFTGTQSNYTVFGTGGTTIAAAATGAGGSGGIGSPNNGLSLQGLFAQGTPVGTVSVGSLNGGVSQTPTPVLSNAAIVLKCIKG